MEGIGKKYHKNIIQFFKHYTVLIVTLGLAIIFGIGNEAFLTYDNFITILRQSSITGIATLGLMFAMISGGLNLASGAIVSLVTVVTALLTVDFDVPWQLAMLLALILAAACGYIIGVFIVKGRIAPMIGSLAMQTILTGLAFTICGGLPIFGIPAESKVLGQGFLGPVPIPILIFVGVAVISSFVLNKTYIGRYFFATGSNEEAARLSGIQTNKVRISSYTISGFLCGIAGIIMYGRVGSGQPTAGLGVEMSALTAAVLGGVSMTGGEGKVFNVCIGCVLLSMLTNGLTLLRVKEYPQMIIEGLVFLIAVLLDSYYHKQKKI